VKKAKNVKHVQIEIPVITKKIKNIPMKKNMKKNKRRKQYQKMLMKIAQE